MKTRRYHRGKLVESSALCPEESALEFLVVCPKCKTMETLVSIGGHFLTNRKFIEREDGIFHNCGSIVPCRIYGQDSVLETSIKPQFFSPDYSDENISKK
jgi:hypothetical protein